MQIRFGYDIEYNVQQQGPIILMLNSAPSNGQRLLSADRPVVTPQVALSTYRDVYGNTCTRFVAPQGTIRICTDALLEDCGKPEAAHWSAEEVPVHALPPEALTYLLGSRYCETDLLSNEAWRLFGHLAPGWSRVQAICDFVNQHVTFGYPYARPTKTAWETYQERRGVCRDFAHLAIAFCRCLNIPARYSTGYLGDIGVPVVPAPMDFAGSMEVYLGGAWHAFDPRNNARRIGRIKIAHGRDAADVAISTAFGPIFLRSFKVWTDEVPSWQAARTRAA